MNRFYSKKGKKEKKGLNQARFICLEGRSPSEDTTRSGTYLRVRLRNQNGGDTINYQILERNDSKFKNIGALS